MKNISTINYVDGYKLDHRRAYPQETTLVYSNWTPRKSRLEGVDKVVCFGLQYFIKRYLIEDFNETFFKLPVEVVTKKYLRRINNYLGANQIGSRHIEDLHRLGYLPLCIKCVPEGTRTPIRVPQATIYNTEPEFFWLVNYLETLWSCSIWNSSTCATIAYSLRDDANNWAIKTGANIEDVKFQCHGFEFRGMSSLESACMTAGAHLLSFVGTDTVPGIDWLEEYYNADSDKELIACSVIAEEHSVMCLGTGFFIKTKGLDWQHYGEAEFEVFKRLLTEVYPTGIISIVSDTYSLWNVLGDYLPRLKDIIMARDGKLVIRPDSGDPVKIICGDSKDVPYDAWGIEEKGVIHYLYELFGGTINKEGYIKLDPHIGMVYGDSINRQRFNEICSKLEEKGFESTSWIAGIGSYTYNFNTRDTLSWCIKSTYGEVAIMEDHYSNYEDNEGDNIYYDPKFEIVGIPIFKDPITDDGTKKSLKGLIQVIKDCDGELWAKDECTWEEEQQGELKEVFRDGKLLVDVTLSEIRTRLWGNK